MEKRLLLVVGILLVVAVVEAVPLSKLPTFLEVSNGRIGSEPCGKEDPECCNGLTCPFVAGVCCKDSQHCCPTASKCILSAEPNGPVMCASPPAPQCKSGACGHSACSCPSHCHKSACTNRPACCPHLENPACSCPTHCVHASCEHKPPCCPALEHNVTHAFHTEAEATAGKKEDKKKEEKLEEQAPIVAPTFPSRLHYQPTQPKSTPPPQKDKCCPSHCVQNACDARPACCPALPKWAPKLDYESSLYGSGAGVDKLGKESPESSASEEAQVMEDCPCAETKNTLSPCGCAAAAQESRKSTAQEQAEERKKAEEAKAAALHVGEQTRMRADFAKGAFLAANLM